MSQDSVVQTVVQATLDGETLTVMCDLDANPIALPWGVELSRYELVIGQEGILMGRLELRERNLAVVESLLSVSPESLWRLSDELRLGNETSHGPAPGSDSNR